MLNLMLEISIQNIHLRVSNPYSNCSIACQQLIYKMLKHVSNPQTKCSITCQQSIYKTLKLINNLYSKCSITVSNPYTKCSITCEQSLYKMLQRVSNPQRKCSITLEIFMQSLPVVGVERCLCVIYANFNEQKYFQVIPFKL